MKQVMTNKQKRLQGFTLIELLIVVAIIIILAVAILIGINPMAQVFKAYDSRRKADISRIQIAIENYYSDHNSYPGFPYRDTTDHFTYDCGSTVLSPYIKSMPCDPNTKKSYTIWYVPKGSSSTASKFAIFAISTALYDAQSTSHTYISQSTDNPYCPGLFVVHSPDMTSAEIIEACSGIGVPGRYFACVNGTCQQLSQDTVCEHKYSTSFCGRESAASAADWCADPSNACNP